jgi:hypothetical protein
MRARDIPRWLYDDGHDWFSFQGHSHLFIRASRWGFSLWIDWILIRLQVQIQAHDGTGLCCSSRVYNIASVKSAADCRLAAPSFTEAEIPANARASGGIQNAVCAASRYAQRATSISQTLKALKLLRRRLTHASNPTRRHRKTTPHAARCIIRLYAGKDACKLCIK